MSLKHSRVNRTYAKPIGPLVYFLGQYGHQCWHVFIVIKKQNQFQSLPSGLNEQFLSVWTNLTLSWKRTADVFGVLISEHKDFSTSTQRELGPLW